MSGVFVPVHTTLLKVFLTEESFHVEEELLNAKFSMIILHTSQFKEFFTDQCLDTI